ncbi:MAG: NTP transferase domain-containing protein [Candidatus Omnitrophica bacterium]|nr:NTP transferase domain-containing protein [Candidatus Omnitrophota bacterium]
MNTYKVCILAAGTGRRLGRLSDKMNKALLPIKSKAIISHIIEKFDKKIEIIIAVGHQKETLIQYVRCAHPDRRIKFTPVKRFKGDGTGPGFSLLQCRQQLKCPFILFTADTLVTEDIPPPTNNWYGVAPIKKPELYCTARVINHVVCHIDDRTKTRNKFAFIGVAGVLDHDFFFEKLQEDKTLIMNEIPLSNGFKALLTKRLKAKYFTWYDTGTLEEYAQAIQALAPEDQYINVTNMDQFTYKVEDRHIFLLTDRKDSQSILHRQRLLTNLIPEMQSVSDNVFTIQKQTAEPFYENLRPQLFLKLYQWLQTQLWDRYELSDEFQKTFQQKCKNLYQHRTNKIIQDFQNEQKQKDGFHYINDARVPPLAALLNRVNWKKILNGTPARVHGKLSLMNVDVKTVNQRKHFSLNNSFTDFDGLIEYGDLYWDLAALYTSIRLNFLLLRKGAFSLYRQQRKIELDYQINQKLLDIQKIFLNCVAEDGYDVQKISILSSIYCFHLIPEYVSPLNEFLFYFAKKALFESLGKKQNEENPEKRPNAESPEKKQNEESPEKRQNAKRPGKRQNTRRPGKRPNTRRPGKRPNEENPGKRQNEENPGKRPNEET